MRQAGHAPADLLELHCQACEGAVEPLAGDELQEYMGKVHGWEMVEGKKIVKTYKFRDFLGAFDFVMDVGRLAESEGHHPDVCFGWGKVKIELSTHKIHGLSANDFILAAKFDAALEGRDLV
jgi:4a-hydroxytetrahydrobiopterin dehydratase